MADVGNTNLSLSTRLGPSPNSDDGSEKSMVKKKPAPKWFVKSQISTEILSDPTLNAATALLPSNYDFEIHKTIYHIISSATRCIALQLPDSLLMYALPLADILRSSSAAAEDVLILVDATYGACCLDDFAASALQADLLVHYGHSCLVPVPSTCLLTLYVFVDIRIDVQCLTVAVRSAFPPSSKLALAGTVQFIAAIYVAKSILSSEGYDIIIPQAKPLFAGEVLRCTDPRIPKSRGVEALLFVADGWFHLEAFMIANPKIWAFWYDPYQRDKTQEKYW